MNADRAGGNPATPTQGDESTFDGSSSLIPHGDCETPPSSTTPYGQYACPNIRPALNQADKATTMVFPL